LSSFFERHLRGGTSQVVVLGGDSPDVPTEWIDEAFQKLTRYSAVLGPAGDGGYYLLGLSKFEPAIFENIDWGTDMVFQQSIQRLKSAGISYDLLPRWEDVDDLPALQRLHSRLASARLADQDPLFELATQLGLLLTDVPDAPQVAT